MTFEEQRKYITKGGRVDMQHFNRVSDITNMIDYHNNMLEKKKEERSDEYIHDVSKMIVRMMTQKNILIGGK